MLSILRPGLILNRGINTRFKEKLLSFVPFFPKIESNNIARTLMIDAENA